MPQTAILIRHADTDGGDVPLNAKGRTRRIELQRVLADADISAIVVSEQLRTRQTAKPLATKLKLVPTQAPDADSALAAIGDLPSDSVVLVVGHTSTLHVISAGLGGPVLPTIGDKQFDHLFVQRGPHVTHLRYGTPTPV